MRDHARVAVRSCHAAGKTLVAAVCACWFLYTHRDAIVLTTASTFRQVRYVFWRTIQGLVTGAARPLGGELLDTELRLGERWYGLGLSTDNPERFQGFHAPHLLVVVDEPGAIPPGVFAAIEGVLASGRTRLLMIGNPTQPDGPFYDAFHAQAGAYRTFRISAFDTPNFLPRDDDRAYLVSPEWVEMRRRLWGADSDLYRARVLGEFPRQAADGLFSLSTLDAAATPGDALPDDGAADPGSAHPACPERSRREALPSGVEGPVEGPSHPPSPSHPPGARPHAVSEEQVRERTPSPPDGDEQWPSDRIPPDPPLPAHPEALPSPVEGRSRRACPEHSLSRAEPRGRRA